MASVAWGLVIGSHCNVYVLVRVGIRLTEILKHFKDCLVQLGLPSPAWTEVPHLCGS